MNDNFDQYAEKYDAWFLKNKNVLYSELKLVAHFLKNTGDALSVGCGSGLFEMLLQQEFNITVKYGIEPSKSMAEIAEKRGMTVRIETAEDGDFGLNQYDAILFNGTPSYINDLQKAFNKTCQALRKGGRIVVIDVPKESSYALLYNLAKVLGTWDHPLLKGVQPKDPYPIEFVKAANWRTTTEKVNMLKEAGFSDFAFAQTLTRHPVYSDNTIEEPMEGFDCGDYVAICAFKNK
ncbi:MAG: class I SAM-dependent methyltransferase [Bacteroidales bacterium]|nr:class I SAM-dependent methyltransferase [Bacteroidales bacterium]MBN2762206.1 class I SAM-dependent methyltransferase [Bacteroidales bacterium]